MSDVLELNLADLVLHYHDRTDAHEATEMLDRSRANQMARLLRDYRAQAIDDAREVAQRDSVDKLLTFYGLVEIGIVAGWLPWPLPDAFADRVRRHLTQPEMLRYYRKFYPLDLPAMLAARLTGWRGPRARLTKAKESLFLAFLDLSAEIEANEAVDQFLWFLDDGYVDEYSLSDCYRAMKTVKSYMAHITTPPKERDALDLAVVGIGDYLSFCRSLDEQLRDAAQFPDLQRAMWCHHAYWLRSVEHDVEEVFERLSSSIRGWTTPKAESRSRVKQLRPDPRLMRLVRGAYRFRATALKVPVTAGKPLESMARREQPTYEKA